MNDMWMGLLGLIGGGLGVLLTFLITKKLGKKKHIYDERQEFVSAKAKAAGWNTTLVLILIAWGLIILFDGISVSFFIMTGLYVAHCLTLMGTSIYFSTRN
ncbi:DUF2178 domain-containing protein [Halobacillus campisalis]|uniref:DUF2178 domain-containing protein n=1 Tax=Halobacillus campisalis TaxID=435909 RepID=A0ABW2K5A6_9BACI|nr:DUF2178 domain-containing protein [Halobacillus campisalis]